MYQQTKRYTNHITTIDMTKVNNTTVNRVLKYTNERLSNWYENAKIDYNVNGSAKATFENDKIVIKAIEEEKEMHFEMNIYGDEEVGYFFDVWASEPTYVM